MPLIGWRPAVFVRAVDGVKVEVHVWKWKLKLKQIKVKGER